MTNNKPEDAIDQELSTQELSDISGGNFSIKDLAERLKVPEGKRANFYKKLMSPKSFRANIDSPVHPYD